MQSDLYRKYQTLFHKEPTGTSFAPGRVNLIGEHTDYNNGFVFPMTVQFGTWSYYGKNDSDLVTIYSYNENDKISFHLQDYPHKNQWSDYLIGCLRHLNIPTGFNMVIGGNIPQGAGLSSSASFELCFIKAMTELFQLQLTGTEAALIGQKSENEFVGCQCGIMDQFISALGKESSAMLIDCLELSFTNYKLPEELDVVVINSNVKRGLVESEYNQRRKTCESAAKKLGVSSLRELSQWSQSYAKHLNPIEVKRSRHVITENQRALHFKEALLKQDSSSLFSILREGHLSLKNDYEVSTGELDFIVDLVESHFEKRAAARMTGGGFGGCVVALCQKNISQDLIDVIESHYERQTSLKEQIYRVQSVHGAFSE